MKLSQRDSKELLAWAAALIPCMHGQPFADTSTAMGVETDAGEIIGVIAFHNYDPWNGTIEVSAAATDARWLLARDAIEAMRRYAFIGCNCQKIWSRTPRSHTRALRLVRALKLKPEAILPRHFGNDDAVISSCFREQFYGQAERTKAA